MLTAILIAALAAGGGPGNKGSHCRGRGRNCGGDRALLRILPTTAGAPGGECSGTSITGTRGETVTFARASSAYCTKADGTMVSLTADQPRVSLISGAPMLLVEGAATNLALRSSELDNASWTKGQTGVPGVPVVTANAVNGPDGTLSADQVAFAAVTGAQESYISQAITVAGSNTASMYLKGASGSGTIDVCYATATVICGQCSYTNTAWSRCTRSFTYSSGTTFYFGNNGSGNGGTSRPAQTVYVWGVQLETGAFATSGIATAGTTATRAVETATVPTPAGWSTSTFCYGAKVQPYASTFAAGSSYGIFQDNTADVANAMRSFVQTSGLFYTYVFDNSAAFKACTAGGISSGGDVVSAWNSGTPTARINGASSTCTITGAGTGIPNSHAATLYLGGNTGASLYGYIGNVRIASSVSGCDR
jgi:hypothetical protein